MSNLVGPDRVMGNWLEVAGRAVERNIGLIAYIAGSHPAPVLKAEQRLKEWVPGTPEGDTYLLTCAASEHPMLQQCAFKLYIDFAIHHLTWHCLNHNYSLEAYHNVRNSLQKAIELDSALSISRWKRFALRNDKSWMLYYEAARFLWTSDDVSSWIITQLRRLRAAHVEWMSKYKAYERMLVYLIASWSCSEPDSWNTLPYNLFIIAINQMQLGPACTDREEVDLLASAVISRMLRDFTHKLDAIYDDTYAVENFFKLITQIRRFSMLFPIAHKQLQNDAQEICKTFDESNDHSNVESSRFALLRVRPLISKRNLRINFSREGFKWTVKPWGTAEDRLSNLF